MSKNHYPGANRTAQYWGGKFVGSTMNTNCVCLHTTETSVWPGYGGGASAPHMTILPNIKAQTVSIRQHFPAGKSSRALVNLAGGVQTNTLNVFQIELIGTCDSRYRESRKEWGKAGVDYIYWPDAPDWLLAAISPVFGWLDTEWPDFKIVDATPRGWVKYPDSYGLKARQRMTAREWASAFGIFGHQHVPENTHGDPGNFPIARLIAAATGKPGTTQPPVPPKPTAPKPQTAVWDLSSTWEIGSTGAAVTKLGQRLVIWAKHLGLPAPYKVGPGPEFTETDRAAVAAFQRAQGWTGEDADGYPGPETFRRLAATPQRDPEPTTGPVVTSASLNAGSYNATGAKTYKARTDRYVNRRLRQLVDVLNFQEVGNGLNRPGKPNARMRARLDKGFGNTYRRHIGSDGRYNCSNRATVKPIKSGVITAAKTAWYRGDNKQASYLVFEKNGVRGMDVSFHLENESGAVADRKRVDQMLSILKQALKIATAEGVDIRNILFVGDTNSEGMVADAMAAARWRNVATGTEYENDRTFTGWDGKSSKRFDYGFVHETAGPATLITVDTDTDVSDHAELVVKRTLTEK